jgi:chromosome segregation ATPase
MSVEPPECVPSSTSALSALSELRGTHNEFAKFFGDALDQLEAMSLELFARHKCLELNAQNQNEHKAAGAEHELQFHNCLEELRDLKAKVCSAHEETAKMWSEISTTHQQLLQELAEPRATQEELRHISTEFRAMREGVEQDRVESRQRQESVEEHLQRLASVVAELAAAQSPSDPDEQLSQVLDAARQQQAAWQQDRAGLEAELEAERQRGAQQNEALAEQRRVVAEQQAELAGELKRMRSLLELLLNHMNQPFGGNSGDGKQTSPSSENAALESMLSQFEMLQRDLAQRRAGKPKDAVKR